MNKAGRKPYLYTVYENRNARFVIKEGTAEECAEAMGMSVAGFHTVVNYSRGQDYPKWDIVIIKKCIYCGQKFEAKTGNSTICSDCKAASGKWDEEFKAKKKAFREAKKKKKADEAKKAKEFKFNKKKCVTCLYRLQMGDEKKQWYCGYCYYTGHKRPCDISPKCAVYKTYSEDKRNQLIDGLKNTV